jgi:pseudouridylate synthase
MSSISTPGQAAVRVSAAVSAALSAGRPVVALESTIFSCLGLPSPANAEALRRCLAAVRDGGAEPAVTAVLDGQARVGLEPGEEERILTGTRKVAERDIAVATAQGVAVGVTTVSASMALAHAAGIKVFATGGIGGVHRGAELSGDISADLDALANHPVITVCAGAKAFLDLARTLEYLETAGVPVLGWQHDWFPAFYLRSSGLPVPHRAETARIVAEVLRGRMRERTGVLLTVPIPAADELDPEVLSDALAAALAACEAEHVVGAAVTPFVLARIEQLTEGASVPANLALAENNARVAAAVAAAVLDAESSASGRSWPGNGLVVT